MAVDVSFLVCLVALSLAALVRCDEPPLGFIFPPNSTFNNASLANLTVHFKDRIVVEYSVGNAPGIVLVTQNCYNTSAPGEGDDYFQATSHNSSSYNATGTLLWDVGNGNKGNYTNINYCQLSIANFTIMACSWGPFGVTSFEQVGSANSDYTLYSAMFKVVPPNGTKPSLFINGQKSTSTGSAAITATASGKVVCPPSGIPALPVVSPVGQVDVYPKLAEGVLFPP